MRILGILTAFTLLVGAAVAGDAGLGGNWKITFLDDGQQQSFWLLKLDSKEGKLAGSVEVIEKGVPATTLEEVKTTGDLVQLTIKLAKGPTFEFEGKLPKPGAKKVYGSFRRAGGPATPAMLEATTAKSKLELDRDFVSRFPNDPKSFAIVTDLLSKENKVSAKDAQEMVESSLKAAELYGPRWQSQFTLRLMDALKGQPDLKEVTLDIARRVEKSLDAKAPLTDRLQVLATLAEALRGAQKLDEAKALDAQIDKLETGAYEEHRKSHPEFKVEKFAGRKGTSDRAVLIELFTGAQCPPCVAADMAFDAVEKAYPSSDVVLLQYHMHIPGPDPLTSPDSEDRFDYYATKYEEAVGGTPASLFNGKPAALGGGGRDDAEDKFKEYRTVIGKLLETPAAGQLSAQASRSGDKITVKASVKELEKVGEKVRLRLVLVEDWVRYKGRNGLTYHHRVVRAMPGGAKGFALPKKEAEHIATLDLNDLRKELTSFLDAGKRPFPDAQRPMRLRDLRLVAFIQDDATTEVLQAVDVPVKGE